MISNRLCIVKSDLSTRSTELEQERVVKKFKIKFGNSPSDKTTRKEGAPSKKSTRLVFEDEMTETPSDEASPKTLLGATGGETLLDRDITDYEWGMLYLNSNKIVVLVTARNKGHGQLPKARLFSYGRLFRLDKEDSDSSTLILLVDCSKRIWKMYVSEDRLVKESCGPESFKFAIETTDNLITTLQPYIQGHVNLREASPSPQKSAPKKTANQSRPTRKKVTKMSKSEDSRSTDEEDNRSTPGEELASGFYHLIKKKLEGKLCKRSS